MDVMCLESLAKEIGGQVPLVSGIGGIMVEPEGFVMMNVQILCVKGYNEDQIAIVMDDPGHTYDLSGDGSNQGKRDLRVGHPLDLL